MAVTVSDIAAAGRRVADWLQRFYALGFTVEFGRVAFATGLITLAISPRSTVVDLVVLAFVGTSVLVAARLPPRVWLEDWRSATALLGFAALALTSTLWSLDPAASLGKSMFLVGAVVAALVAMRSAPATPRPVLAAAVEGLIMGYLIQIVGVAFEILTDQHLARTVLQAFPSLQEGPNKHVFVSDGVVVRVSEAEISRRICVAVLLLLPMLYAMRELLSGRRRKIALTIAGVATAVILLQGHHQSSQLALVVGAVALALWHWSPTQAIRIAIVGWLIGAALAVPIAGALYDARMDESRWLFKSARERVVIWGTTAERVGQNFWGGIGADATAAARDVDARAAGGAPPKQGEFARTVGRHAHNVFLQVWLELGALGAALLALVGAMAFRSVSRLPPALGRMAFGQLAMTAVMLSASYGMWQIWLQSAIAIAIVIFWMAHIVASNGSAFATPRR